MARNIIDFILVLLLCVATWFAFNHEKPSGNHTEAEKNPDLGGVEQVEIKPEKIYVYVSEAKKDLPDKLKDNENIHVVDGSLIPASDRQHVTTTVLDTSTGKFETVIEEKPLKWFDASRKESLRLSYGVADKVGLVGRITYTNDIFQIKAMNFGVEGSLYTNGGFFAGIGLSYRW